MGSRQRDAREQSVSVELAGSVRAIMDLSYESRMGLDYSSISIYGSRIILFVINSNESIIIRKIPKKEIFMHTSLGLDFNEACSHHSTCYLSCFVKGS